MTAYVRPFSAAMPVATPAAENMVRAAAHPLQTALCDCAVQAAQLLVQRFDEQLDSALQSLAAEARNAAETREALDLGQALSCTRQALQRSFVDALRRRFDPLTQKRSSHLFDLERLSVLPTEELEENIALIHLGERAEEAGGEASRQLNDNLRRAAKDLSLPMLADALAPAALGACFSIAFRKAQLEPAQRLLALRLVESQVPSLWPVLIESALHCVQTQGYQFARSLGQGSAAWALPALTEATQRLLRETRASLAAPADAALAAALLQLAVGPVVAVPGYVVLSLMGHWMDSLVADAMLPQAFVPDMESLRLPAIKAALADAHVLENPRHPVRQDIQQIFQSAAFAGVQGVSLAPLRESVKKLSARITVQAAFAYDALKMLQPLASDLPEQFIQQMAADDEQRREALLRDVRAQVHREIEARTLDLALPSAARAALARGFFPLLCTLFLRHGAAAPKSRQARNLLERFVDSFTLCCTQTARATVMRELCITLAEAGLPEVQINGLVSELRAIYSELEQEAQAALRPSHDNPAEAEREINAILATLEPQALTPLWPVARQAIREQPRALMPHQAANEASPAADPAAQLLSPGRWFRVRDYRRGEDRWLSLGSYLPQQDRVTFRSSEGAAALAMRATQLLEDLASGIAEPVNPDAAATQALVLLKAAPQRQAQKTIVAG
jgi:hypothetical protein